MKEETVSHAEKWMEAHCQTFNATGEASTAAMAADEPRTYAISVESISPWHISNNVKRKLEETQCLGERKIACSVSMSFFHATSKTFYGSTTSFGHEHVFLLKNILNHLSINLNELVYFQTKVVDPNSVVVCELVASLFDQFGEDVEKRYGCGFAVISPFSDCEDDERLHSDPVKSGLICIYDGSPRDLLDAKEPGSISQQLRKQETKCMMSYKVWRCGEIGAAIKSLSVIREDQIVGSHTKIAGLASTTIDCFDNRGSLKLPCIGAKTRGGILDWILVPSESIQLAPTFQLNIDKLIVSIPNRLGFEEACCQWITNTHSRHDGILGRVSGLLRNCSSPIKGNRNPIIVVSRRVRVGAHNGHRFMHWHVIELQQDANSDVLKMDASLNMPAINDEDFAIVFVFEYTCEENVIKSPTKLPPRSYNVTVGTTVLSPFKKESQGIGSGVILNLINDAGYNIYSSNSTFSPSNAPSCTISFDINTQERNATGESKQTILPQQLSAPLDSMEQKEQIVKVAREPRDEAKEEYSFESIHYDTSTLTFDETLIEEKDNSDEESPTPRPAAPASAICYQHDYSILTEVEDENNATEVTIKLVSFSLSDIGQKMFREAPRSLSFCFKLLEHDEVSSEHFLLQKTVFRAPSLLSFEYRYKTPEHAKMLAAYMLQRPMFIDVFDDCKFHLGTIALPLHLLVRQGKQKRSMENIAVDVIAPRDHDGVLVIKEGIATCGFIVGSVSLSIDLKGKPRLPAVTNESKDSPKRHALNLLDTNSDLRALVAKIRCEGHESSENCSKSKTDSADDNLEHRSQSSVHSAVDAYTRRYHKERDRVDSLMSLAKEITPEGPHRDEQILLYAAKVVRERIKKDVIADHIAKRNEPTVISVSPFVGQSLLIEIEVTNPLAVEECFVIKSTDQSVSLVTFAKEWDRRRRGFGAIICTGKESLVNFDSLQKDRITMKAHQTLLLPILLDQQTPDFIEITVSLISSKRIPVHSIKLAVTPLLQVDRRFTIPCRKNENIKRRFGFQARDATPLTVKVVDKTARGVKCEWSRYSSDSNDALYHLTIDAAGVDEESENFMYVVISNDHFVSILESWKFVFEARTPLYDTACLGARMRQLIVIKGGEEDRVLKCRAAILPNQLEAGGSTSICQFEKSSFQLLSNQVNRMHVDFQFQAQGSWNVLLNCIDQDSGEIAQSFILTVQCFLPAISKEYSIEAFPGKAKQVKLPFTNCLAQTRTVEIASSNDLILLPQTPKLQLGEGETVYARFRVKVEESMLVEKDIIDGIDVFLFTRDLSTKNEDCIRIRIKIPDL